MYYGIFRYFYFVQKIGMGDPTDILFTDKYMRINILLWFLVCIAVIYFKI